MKIADTSINLCQSATPIKDTIIRERAQGYHITIFARNPQLTHHAKQLEKLTLETI